jgi:transposase-like protein
MNSKRKTAEQKEKILIDIKNMGVLEGCRKHNISVPTYYQWKRQYDTGGINSLKQRKVDKAEIEQLKKDNAMLKELVAEKEIVIKLQDETIKKNLKLWAKGKK